MKGEEHVVRSEREEERRRRTRTRASGIPHPPKELGDEVERTQNQGEQQGPPDVHSDSSFLPFTTTLQGGRRDTTKHDGNTRTKEKKNTAKLFSSSFLFFLPQKQSTQKPPKDDLRPQQHVLPPVLHAGLASLAVQRRQVKVRPQSPKNPEKEKKKS